MKLLILSSIALVATALVGTAEAAGLKVGDTPPDFSLKGSDGKTHKLSDYKGKQAVVIAWFPKAFTGGCTAECKSMRDSSKEIHKYDVAYFTASVDDAETNKKFAESLGLDFPILSDPEKDTAKEFGVLNERGMASRWTALISEKTAGFCMWIKT